MDCAVVRNLFETKPSWLLWAPPVIPLVIAAILLLAYRILRSDRKALIVILCTLAIVLSVVTFVGSTLPDLHLLEAVETGNYALVEGIVTQFHPQFAGRREYETFSVDGTTFRYTQSSDFAFNHTAGTGGPIHQGMKLRVGHVAGRIVRIDECR
jgi:hypothetical protein